MGIKQEQTKMGYNTLILVIMASINIAAWNMRSVNHAHVYVNDLCKTYDIICASEHRLYNYELNKLDAVFQGYSVYAKASSDLVNDSGIHRPGHCGTLIAWRNHLSPLIQKVPVDNDRICAIKINNIGMNKNALYVIGIYLPQKQCKIASFDTCLAQLEDLVEVCQSDGEVIIIGDMNAHFGSEYGDRFWGNTSANAKSLANMTEQLSMTIIDSESNRCQGPNYSFYVDGVGCSYIDHCIVSKRLIPHITSCKMISEELHNTSDHLPIAIHVNVSSALKQESDTTGHCAGHIAWNKIPTEIIKSQYTDKLEVLLATWLSKHEKCDCDTDVDELALEINNCIHNAAQGLKQTRYSKGLKPYWSKELEQSCKEERKLGKEWRDAKRPRDGEVYVKYKKAKASFRRKLRDAKLQYEKAQMDSISEAHDLDHKQFWSLINNIKNKVKATHPIQVDGKTVTEPGEICNEWRTYFKELYTPKAMEHYDDQFKDYVDESVTDMLQKSYNESASVMSVTISESEVYASIKSLKNGKAPGWDAIVAEHLKHGGQSVIACLTKLFNAMITIEHIPKALKVGIIIPIPKGDKDPTILNNNRGITLLPVIAKVFEKVLLERHLQWAGNKNIIDQLQGASQDRCSSLHTSLLLRETIAYNNECNSTVYVALLDMAKAFDLVWINGLLYKLHQSGMDPVIWRMLKKSYTDFTCHVRIKNNMSDSFTAGTGVHQGAPWSMYLFQVNINDLLTILKTSGLGATIRQILTSNPAFADDLAIACLHKAMLQRQLNIVWSFSQTWRCMFNSDKSVVIIFGKDHTPNQHLYLGNLKLRIVNGDLHLGTLLYNGSKDIEASFVKSRINKTKKAFFSVQGIGSRSMPIPSAVMSKVYWSKCMPILTHGVELMSLSDKSIGSMEQAHGEMAKMAQGLPSQAANVSCLATLGWKCLSTYIDTLRLLFLWRLLLLPVSCIYKQVLILRLYHHLYCPDRPHIGPIYQMLQVYRRYGLIDVLDCALTTGNVIPLSKFKCIVKCKAQELETDSFEVTCMLYKTLKLFKECIKDIEMWPWWAFASKFPEYGYKVRIMCRLLMDRHCLKEVTCRFDTSSPKCILCADNVIESVDHMLFKCEALNCYRDDLWKEVLESAPEAMKYEFHRMTDKEKCIFIFSGFRCKFVTEWRDLYISVMKFCTNMYHARHQWESTH